MKIKIKRQASPFSEPYWQTFLYEGPKENTIAGVLDDLNYRDDIKDIDGQDAPRISWECSCLQGMCGSCAMVINGRPALACETFLRDLIGDEITIEPLSKFMTISDLVVDRAVLQENLKTAGTYIKAYKAARPEDYAQQYATAKCLKCGLCLEVCPNYKAGQNFFGAAFANDCYLIESQSADEDQSLREAYDKHFAAGCSKSLSCETVCPMQIETIASIARMNRRKR